MSALDFLTPGNVRVFVSLRFRRNRISASGDAKEFVALTTRKDFLWRFR
jgi:hypothetical protein